MENNDIDTENEEINYFLIFYLISIFRKIEYNMRQNTFFSKNFSFKPYACNSSDTFLNKYSRKIKHFFQNKKEKNCYMVSFLIKIFEDVYHFKNYVFENTEEYKKKEYLSKKIETTNNTEKEFILDTHQIYDALFKLYSKIIKLKKINYNSNNVDDVKNFYQSIFNHTQDIYKLIFSDEKFNNFISVYINISSLPTIEFFKEISRSKDPNDESFSVGGKYQRNKKGSLQRNKHNTQIKRKRKIKPKILKSQKRKLQK